MVQPAPEPVASMAVSVRGADTFAVTPLGPLAHFTEVGPSMAREPGETVAVPETEQRAERSVPLQGADEAAEQSTSAGPRARTSAMANHPTQNCGLHAFNTAPLSRRSREGTLRVSQ